MGRDGGRRGKETGRVKERSNPVNGRPRRHRNRGGGGTREIERERGDIGGTLEMGSQPYSSLHFIYIPGRIDQSDWEQSPGLRRGIKRQNAFAALIPP